VDNLTKMHRIARVFLARLILVCGFDAPAVLRRIADELEWLEMEESNSGGDSEM
jgi:hypothetical protein